MPNLNLNLTPDQATALYLALDNTIYFGTDFRDRFTKQQREDVLDIFKQATYGKKVSLILLYAR